MIALMGRPVRMTIAGPDEPWRQGAGYPRRTYLRKKSHPTPGL